MTCHILIGDVHGCLVEREELLGNHEEESTRYRRWAIANAATGDIGYTRRSASGPTPSASTPL